MRLTIEDIGRKLYYKPKDCEVEVVGIADYALPNFVIRFPTMQVLVIPADDNSLEPIPSPEERAQKAVDEINRRLGDFQAEVWDDNGVEPGKRISLFRMPITIEQAEQLLGWRKS